MRICDWPKNTREISIQTRDWLKKFRVFHLLDGSK